jgi:hypothetical protein
LVLGLLWKVRVLRVEVNLSAPTCDFESALWKGESQFAASQNNRSMMLDDLMHFVLVPGMKREDVRALLGPPEGNLVCKEADSEQADIYPVARNENGLQVLVVAYENDELVETREVNLAS